MADGSTTEIAVVGGGLMGASTAWHLARRGHAVTLFEQFAFDHRRGSSHGEVRQLRLVYEQEEYVQLAQRSIPAWREVEAALGEDLFLPTGGFDLGLEDALAPLQATLDRAGVPYDVFSAGQMRQRFPAYSLPADYLAIYQPNAGLLYADAARRGLLALAARAGADLHPETEVLFLEPRQGGVSVHAATGDWQAERAVIASGAWGNKLLQPLGLAVPLTVTREHVMYCPYLGDARFLPFNWHRPGGGIDFYGMPNGRRPEAKTGRHGTGPETDPDLEGTVEPERLEPVRDFIHRHLPAVSPRPLALETCLYASTPDDDFVLDRIGPFVLGLGLGGHGFKFGALLGSLLADLVEEKAATSPRFAHARFQTAVG